MTVLVDINVFLDVLTRNRKDFQPATLPVLTPEAWLSLDTVTTLYVPISLPTRQRTKRDKRPCARQKAVLQTLDFLGLLSRLWAPLSLQKLMSSTTFSKSDHKTFVHAKGWILCRGRPPCLPSPRATTGGCPYI